MLRLHFTWRLYVNNYSEILLTSKKEQESSNTKIIEGYNDNILYKFTALRFMLFNKK